MKNTNGSGVKNRELWKGCSYEYHGYSQIYSKTYHITSKSSYKTNNERL